MATSPTLAANQAPATGFQPAFKRVAQTDDFSCWIACIAMIVNRPLDEVRKVAVDRFKLPKNGPYRTAMPTKLCKWGNSLGLRLPQYVIERTGLRHGDQLFVKLNDAGDIVIRPCKEREVHAGYAADDAPQKLKHSPATDEEILADW